MHFYDYQGVRSFRDHRFKFESHGTKGFTALILHMVDFIKKNILMPLGLYREHLILKHCRESDFPKSIQTHFKLCCKHNNLDWKVEKKNVKQFGIAYIYNWCKNNQSDHACLLMQEIEEKYGKANLDIRKDSELIIDKSFLEYYKNIET